MLTTSKPAVKRRASTIVPGLSYELRQMDGYRLVRFTLGSAFLTLALDEAGVHLYDCSDRASLPGAVEDHCRLVARNMASTFYGQAVAA